MAAEKTMGTVLKMGTGTPTTIGGVDSIGAIGVESEEIEVTTLDSPDGYREFIAGLKDAGEIAIKGVVKSDAQLQTLLGKAEDQTVEDWEVDFPSGTKWTFSGFVKALKEGEITIDGKRTFEMTIRVTGKPTFTPAA